MYCGREKRMNESALEGFVKIVEMNSFSAAAEALLPQLEEFLTHQWKGSCSLSCSSMYRAVWC